MSIVKYAVIDANGKVESCYEATEPPVLHDPSLSFVINTAGADCGWSYIDGQFIEPPRPELPYIPESIITIESIQSKMTELQSQLAMLLAKPTN
jgi:hypothetical protein